MALFPDNRSDQQPSEAEEIGMEIGRVRDMLADSETCELLTEWEQKFCADMAERVDRFAEATRMSEKQWDVFERIEKKMQKSEV